MNNYVLAELYPKDRNLKARWFVKWGIWDVQKGKIVYEQKRVPSKLKTVREREKWAKECISQINKMLLEGYVIDTQTEVPTSSNVPANTNIIEALNSAMPIKLSELRNTSQDSYNTVYRKFKAYLEQKGLTGMYARDFEKSHIIEYRAYLINELGNVNRTANNNLINLGALFGIMKTQKHVINDPFEDLKGLPETDSDSNVAFSKEHQEVLENWMKVNDPILYLFTRFLYFAFIRPKELRQLKGTHLDLQKKSITIPGKIAKNRKTQTVPINQKLLELLGTKVDSLPNKYLFGKSFEWLSLYQCGENYAYNRHCKALEACDLMRYDYTLYSWKHTGACRAIEAGVNPRKLQGLLRHSSLEETDIYLRSLGISLQNEELKETW